MVNLFWKRFPVLLVLALVLVLRPCAGAAQSLEWDPAVKRGALDNGMQYFIMQNHKPEQRVELRLLVRAGSVLETDEQQGIAHFIEHMGFNGTEHFKAGELVDYFQSRGVEFGPDTNAYTSFDHTLYMLSLPVDQETMDKGFLAMRDYAGGMLFAPQEVEKEKGVVLEELRLGRDMYTRIMDKALAIALKGTPYPDRMPIGKADKIEKFSPELCKAFYSQWYRPDNMAFIVVGDIDPAAMEQAIKDTFSTLKNPQDEFTLPVFPDAKHKDIIGGIVTDPELPLSMVFVAYTRDPSRITTVDEYKQSVVQNLAMGIYNNRLTEITLAGDPPFKEADGSAGWTMLGFDIVTAFAQTDMKKESKALERLMTEIERIRRHGVLPAELDEVRSSMAESLRAAVQEKDKRDSAPLAGGIAMDYFYSNVFMEISASKDLFDALSPGITDNDIQAELERLFEPVNMAALFVMPEFQKSLYKESDVVSAVEQAREADVPAYTREEAHKSTDYSTLTPGKIKDTQEFKDLGATAVTFDNGVRVIFKSTDFQKDEILFTTFAPGGVLLETIAHRGAGRLASDAWLMGGTEDLTAVQIDRMISGKTINIHAMGRELYGLTGNTVDKDFEETLQWMRDYITMPGFREQGVDKAKSLMMDALKETDADQTSAFRKAMTEQLCPGHPVSYWPDADQVPGIAPDTLKTIHFVSTAPANLEFTFVGNLDVDKAVTLAARYLGSIPIRTVGSAPAEAYMCRMPSGKVRRVIYRGMEQRTQIALFFDAPASDSPDAAAVEIMAKVADTRMIKRLREELSGTYYAYMATAFSPVIRNRDHIMAAMASEPDRVDEMIAEFDTLVKKLIDEGPTGDELDAAKKIVANDHQENLKKNGYWLGALSGKLATGKPLGLNLEIADAVQSVTADQVKAAAAKYLQGGTRIEIIALPEKAAAVTPE